MKYNVTKNWTETLDMLMGKPAILLPFFFIAFFESLALELIYFSCRKPVLLVAGPLIKKLFSESFLHYPANLMLLPKLFYYAQITIYVLVGVFLISCSVQIFKNAKANLPVIPKAIINNSLKRYFAFLAYAILTMVVISVTQKAQSFVFLKITHLTAKYLPIIPEGVLSVAVSASSIIVIFLATIVIYTLLMLTIPLIVIDGLSLLRAVGRSIYTGVRNFTALFRLIFFPFLIYLPLMALKSFSALLVSKTLPEINLYVTIVSIITSAFVDCFIIISLSQFLLDIRKAETKAS